MRKKTKCLLRTKKTNKKKPKTGKTVIDNNKTSQLVSIIILSDFPGYRMKSYGPSPLITINNKCLIDLQIEAIKKRYDNYEIILCTGFDSDKIAKYIFSKYHNTNIRIVENTSFNNSNSCESLRIALNNICNDKVLVIDGNLLFNFKTLQKIPEDKLSVLIQNKSNENLEIGVNLNSNKIAQFFSFGAYRSWSEIFFINDKTVIDKLRKFLSNQDNKKKFIFEALNDLLKTNIQIECIENNNVIYKINNIKTYHYLKDQYEIFNQ